MCRNEEVVKEYKKRMEEHGTKSALFLLFLRYAEFNSRNNFWDVS